jgi:hypothetical protein
VSAVVVEADRATEPVDCTALDRGFDRGLVDLVASGSYVSDAHYAASLITTAGKLDDVGC